MAKKKQTVTLEVIYDTEGISDPADWDWADLVDAGGDVSSIMVQSASRVEMVEEVDLEDLFRTKKG